MSCYIAWGRLRPGMQTFGAAMLSDGIPDSLGRDRQLDR